MRVHSSEWGGGVPQPRSPSFYPTAATRVPTPAQRADLIHDLETEIADLETEGLASAVAESCLL